MKKGQVTVFIIIGVLLLVVFATILILTQTNITEDLTSEGIPVIAQVPTQFEPIQTFTENCVQQVGKRGLILLGQQGGYIYPELVGTFTAADPTNADGLTLSPLQIPYWYYNKNHNDDSSIGISSLQPELSKGEMSVEAQLQRYVEENVDNCLQGYSGFVKEGFVITQGDKQSRVSVLDNAVHFTLSMPVSASLGSADTNMEQFFVSIPLALKEYYDLAGDIADAQENLTFLERQGLDLIQVYSGVDRKKLPPTTAVKFDKVATTQWTVPDVENNFKSMLSSNVPLLRLLDSNNFFRYQYPTATYSAVSQQNYDNMILPLIDASDVDVTFDYFNWPMYFQVNSPGNTIRPNQLEVGYDFLQFQFQQYNTRYDVSYPVLVTVHDKDAFNGEGYTLSFAMESNIRSNLPAESDNIVTPFISAQGSLLCNNPDIPLITQVVDGKTANPLEAVNIGFQIPRDKECDIGLTNNDGELDGKFPSAYGGMISYEKVGYLKNFYPIDTKKMDNLVGAASSRLQDPFTLYPFQKIKATVKKKEIAKCVGGDCYSDDPFFSKGNEVASNKPDGVEKTHAWFYSGAKEALYPADIAILTFELMNGPNVNVITSDYTATLNVEGDSESEIELVPGTYKVSAVLLSDEPLVVHEEERCVGGLLGECFTLDEQYIDSMNTGLFTWESPQTYLTISPNTLYGSESVEFYIPSFNYFGVPGEELIIEDLGVSAELEDFTKIPHIRTSLLPKFK